MKQTDIPKTLMIVPAYNEEESLAGTLTELMYLKEKFNQLEVCVINDGSTDQTVAVAKQFDVILLDLPQNLGIGGAVQTGYKYAHNHDFDIAVQFDADGQHNADDLMTLLSQIMNDEADMVIGSRFLVKTDYKGGGMRRIGIYYFYLLLKLLTGERFTDATSGYRAINKEVIKIFAHSYPKDYPEPEVIIKLHKKGLRIKEVTANMFDRQGGESSITPLRSVYYMSKVSLAIVMQKIIKE